MWRRSESAELPQAVERNNGTVYVRKNISTKEIDDVTYYVYDECEMTEAEYTNYANTEYIAMMTDVELEDA